MIARFQTTGAAYDRKKRRWLFRTPRHHADMHEQPGAREEDPDEAHGEVALLAREAVGHEVDDQRRREHAERDEDRRSASRAGRTPRRRRGRPPRSSPCARSRAYTGMKDAESTPSPKRFCRKFGIRVAEPKASAASDVPRYRADHVRPHQPEQPRQADPDTDEHGRADSASCTRRRPGRRRDLGGTGAVRRRKHRLVVGHRRRRRRRDAGAHAPLGSDARPDRPRGAVPPRASPRAARARGARAAAAHSACAPAARRRARATRARARGRASSRPRVASARRRGGAPAGRRDARARGRRRRRPSGTPVPRSPRAPTPRHARPHSAASTARPPAPAASPRARGDRPARAASRRSSTSTPNRVERAPHRRLDDRGRPARHGERLRHAERGRHRTDLREVGILAGARDVGDGRQDRALDDRPQQHVGPQRRRVRRPGRWRARRRRRRAPCGRRRRTRTRASGPARRRPAA